MRINELLNASTRMCPSDADWDMEQGKTNTNVDRKRMNMTSLGPFTRPHRTQSDLSMNRIIQELKTSQAHSTSIHFLHPTLPFTATSSTAAHSQGSRSHGRLGPLSDLEKRVKQRMLVKRSYYRKLDTLNKLREQVKVLEHRFHQVLHTSPPISSPHAGPSTSSSGVDALRAQYTQLAVAQDALRRENEQLRAQAMDQSKMGTRVRILLDEELRDQLAARDALERVHQSPLPPLASPSASPRPPVDPKPSTPPATSSAAGICVAGLTICPLTAADCRTITHAAVADVRGFRDAETRADSTGACVFGWRDRRRVDPDDCTLRFCLEKTFRHLPARELARRMWGLVSTAPGLSRIYASARSTRFVRLQCVDDRNVLFYREMRADGGGVVKSLVLASLMDLADEDADRFLVLVRSVDPWARIVARETEEDEDETWADVFSWGVYESAGPNGEHCRNAFGGFVRTSPVSSSPGRRPPVPTPPGTIRADTAFWLMLVLVIAVRCESEVVGSPFLLPSE